ncbi:PREDICTED: uncharacterized protein LOC104800605 [Tarenaya hassleriana]|uniref:uncharacterized protein LOC104800605 n=1 Tax=Tarenaya hassleriana TaxID=28532 RepID=UPI00053C0803|nr:PREDICTED: uncharacterized protein LOC104800605 [Tarenaya hassleriana]
MPKSSCYYRRPSHRFISGEQTLTTGSEFELDERDLYNHEPADLEPSGLALPDLNSTGFRAGLDRNRFLSEGIVSTVPVNVPDWSKILGEEKSDRRKRAVEEDGGDDVSGGEGRRLPPHEIMARRRMASFSVHEGAGRTLKGRDLRRVRNAIFEITGFHD